MEEWMKKLQESTNLNIRNHNASLKNLETQIEQLEKDYQAKAANEILTPSVGQCKVPKEMEERTQGVLPCQLPPKELNPGSFTLLCTIVLEQNAQLCVANNENLDSLGSIDNLQGPRVDLRKKAEILDSGLITSMWHHCNGGESVYGKCENGMLKYDMRIKRLTIQPEKEDTKNGLRETISLMKKALRREKHNILMRTSLILLKGERPRDFSFQPLASRRIMDISHQEDLVLSIKSYFPTSSSVSGDKPQPHNYSFEEWLKVKIRHTDVDKSVINALLNEWMLDSFDIKADFEGIRNDPYSRSLDEYTSMFDKEIEQLANGYELRIGKKGYILDDIWKKCERVHGGTLDPWHDEVHEEVERGKRALVSTSQEIDNPTRLIDSQYAVFNGTEYAVLIFLNEYGVLDRKLDTPYPMEVDTPYRVIDQNSAQIRRIFHDGYGVLVVRTTKTTLTGSVPLRGRFPGKLSPRYIGPFKILARVGPVAYTLELPEELKGIHSTFYVLNLKKCLAEGDIVVPMDEIQLDDKLHMIEETVEVVDREVKRLKQSRIPIIKVHWNSQRGPEFTWEYEDQIRKKYHHLFTKCPKPPRDKNQRAFVGGSWSNSGEENDEKIQDETCLICLGVDLEPDEWIKDSGCSKHMTGNRKLFSTYKAYNGGNVIFGSNLRGNIIGKGQICDNKCRVTFSEHDSEITKSLRMEKSIVKKRKSRFLKNKTEAFDQFEIFSKKIQNQLGCTIVSIRTDHGREFDNKVQFGEFCNANGITHNFSAPRTPQSNGVVERKNKTLQEMSRTMLNEQSLPQKFWCNAVDTSTYILNRILIRAILGKTPYEILRGRKPTLDYFRVFGSKCFILNTKDYLTKFDPKSYEGVFLGYSQNSKAYIILNKHTRKIEESLNVTFDETPPPSKTSPLVDDDLDEEDIY
ncbi:retrovirus-related pol polyprotein from transposon TNT 1-94 [Tanacetum coccineum]|uniref:Retrovirus-related pol polyprotein from transposon TNT 1-94 n=1 Tax=Tanacetum coccineum TaxID=301880 RepID=A0ABQ5IPK0_9ASTR